VPTDAEAVPLSFEDSADQPMVSLPANNRLVIYELPTAWTKTGDAVNATNIGVGTFQDVLAPGAQIGSAGQFFRRLPY